MKRSVAVVVVLLAVVGCSKAKPKAEPAAQPAAKPPTCAEAAGAFAAWSRSFADQPEEPKGVKLADVAGPLKPNVATPDVLVVMTADKAPATVAAELLAAETREPRVRVALAIAPDVPWGRIVTLADALVAGEMTYVMLLFHRTDAVPARTPYEDELRAATSVQALSQLVAARVNRCPAAASLFGAMSMADPPTRIALLVDGLADAVKECDCALDVPSARAIVSVMRGAPVAAALVLNLSGPVVSAAADVPWSKVHGLLLDATGYKDAKLAVAP